MNISYSDPLTRAWNRMMRALLKPFEIGKWFTIGFTAFLATLMNGIGSIGGSNTPGRKIKNTDWLYVLEWPSIAWHWLVSHPVWFLLIILGVVFFIALLIVFTWLSSRGKFMFIDNVVNDFARVINPWNEYKKEGNSLFVWRLIFGFIGFLLASVMIVITFILMIEFFNGDFNLTSKIIAIIMIVSGFLILIIFISFISMLLNDFVVPLMYKYRITTNQAWSKFLPVLFSNFWDFVVYGLFVLALLFLVVISILLFGLFSCCIGFLLLVIPYIGSVVMLPVTYTYRSFSIEFIEQYGEQFTIFHRPELLKDLPKV